MALWIALRSSHKESSLGGCGAGVEALLGAPCSSLLNLSEAEGNRRAKAKASSWEEPGVGAGSEQSGVKKRQAVE